jgi:hypothetical protein
MFRDSVEPVLRRTLDELWARAGAFVPNVVAMLLILAAGTVIAGAVYFGLRLALPVLGFDAFASRTGLRTLLQRGGLLRAPSRVVALVVAWTVLAGFVILAIGVLDLQIAVDLLSRAFLFLPQVLIALALLLLGLLVGAFLRRSVLIAAVNAGMPSARFLAASVQTAVIALAVAMALSQLGVAQQIIVVAFTIVFGGIVLALALAVGLGGQEMARDALRRLIQRPPVEEAPEDTFRHL